MTTYRERRLAKAERLRDWADSREQKSAAAARASHDATAQIPFGQPILVGHHSQHRHERAIERSWNQMGAAVEHARTAENMRSRAESIEAAADHAIYDDDPDAIERLREKIAGLEARRERMKAANAAYRKEHKDELKAMSSAYERHNAVPFPSYSISNIGGVLSKSKERLARLERGPVDRIITARFDSTCETCGAALTKGEQIRYNRRQGARCLTCEASDE